MKGYVRFFSSRFRPLRFVFSHEVKAHGKTALVVDKCSNIAGNICTYNVEGSIVRKYGARISYVNSKNVWIYITLFVEFDRFTNSPMTNYKGKLYSIIFNMYTFNKAWGASEEFATKIVSSVKEALVSRRNWRSWLFPSLAVTSKINSPRVTQKSSGAVSARIFSPLLLSDILFA